MKQAFRHITDPVDGSSCDTYFHRPATDASGYTSVAIINDDLRLGVYLRYLRKDFPFMVEWKNILTDIMQEKKVHLLDEDELMAAKGAFRLAELYYKWKEGE